MYGNRTPKEIPPCETCRVVLDARNADAAKIYTIVQNQVLVAGMGQVIGINHLAVWEAIDRYQVKNHVECFEKVIGLHSHMSNKDE